jgi:hypothetical protein
MRFKAYSNLFNSNQLRGLAAGSLTLGGAVLMGGCGPGASIAAGSLLLLAWPFARAALAGPPRPCPDGPVLHCAGGNVVQHCCAWHANDALCTKDATLPPFVSCGRGTCIDGHDAGRCPAPDNAPMLMADSAEACRSQAGNWRRACVDGRVAEACVPPLPTNFGGPPQIAPFHTCAADRCTTHVLVEQCYPKAGEAVSFGLWTAPPACVGPTGLGVWQKVCFDGAVEERCLPQSMLAAPGGARAYVMCPDGSCVVGKREALCPQPAAGR